MTPLTKKLASFYHFPDYFLRTSPLRSFSSLPTIEDSIQAAVAAKTYGQIPNLLIASKECFQNPNPFSFLSTFPIDLRIQTVDEILQSFIPIIPRHRSQIAYSCLLSYSLQTPHPLPIALAILQRTLRSGCSPVPQTHLDLSNAWLDRRRQSNSVSKILLEMESIGYHPDTDTCNYLIASLCAVDRLTEAIDVLKGMGGAGCVPHLESYDAVICKMCKLRRTKDVFEMVKKMVEKIGLAPREATMVKVVRAMRVKKEFPRAVEVIEVLEKAGLPVGFEIYELVVEGCLQYREFVLAGKLAMHMVDRGFIPYINTRHKVVEGLASRDELELASALRNKFVELNS